MPHLDVCLDLRVWPPGAVSGGGGSGGRLLRLCGTGLAASCLLCRGLLGLGSAGHGAQAALRAGSSAGVQAEASQLPTPRDRHWRSYDRNHGHGCMPFGRLHEASACQLDTSSSHAGCRRLPADNAAAILLLTHRSQSFRLDLRPQLHPATRSECSSPQPCPSSPAPGLSPSAGGRGPLWGLLRCHKRLAIGGRWRRQRRGASRQRQRCC